MSKKDLIEIFPNLERFDFRVTSDPTPVYNCMAWAFEDQRHWFEPYGVIVPVPFPPIEWPNDDADFTVQTYSRVILERGYIQCDDGELEDQFEKIALYTMNDEAKRNYSDSYTPHSDL